MQNLYPKSLKNCGKLERQISVYQKLHACIRLIVFEFDRSDAYAKHALMSADSRAG